MTASLESKLDVMAMGYDHYRLLRDDAGRAAEYLARVIAKGGDYLDSDWWINFPEPVQSLTLEDLRDALETLFNDMQGHMYKIKEKAEIVAREGGLVPNSSMEALLYNLAQKQRKEEKKFKKKMKDANMSSEAAIEQSIIESMRDLPELGDDQSYQFEGNETKNGVTTPKWSIVDTPKKKGKFTPESALEQESKLETQKKKWQQQKAATQSTFKLRRRPKA